MQSMGGETMNNKEIADILTKRRPESAKAFQRALNSKAAPWEWNKWQTLESPDGHVMATTQDPAGPDFEFIAAARSDIPRMANELAEALVKVEKIEVRMIENEALRILAQRDMFNALCKRMDELKSICRWIVRYQLSPAAVRSMRDNAESFAFNQETPEQQALHTFAIVLELASQEIDQELQWK